VGQEFERLHTRIAHCFARLELRRRALTYLQGIVISGERKNSWHLAKHTGESSSNRMQRSLNSAVWDADLVRHNLRAYILEQLDDPHAVLVIDAQERSQTQRKSARVAMQHCGITGQLENGQVGVFLA